MKVIKQPFTNMSIREKCMKIEDMKQEVTNNIVNVIKYQNWNIISFDFSEEKTIRLYKKFNFFIVMIKLEIFVYSDRFNLIEDVFIFDSESMKVLDYEKTQNNCKYILEDIEMLIKSIGEHIC